MAERNDRTHEEQDRALRSWRQGDYALGVEFLYAELGDEASGEVFDARADGEAVGAVVVSQTCDIVNLTAARRFVTMCPLVRVAPNSLTEIALGRRPTHASLQSPPEDGVVADLTRAMSVSKELLATWERHSGFDDDVERENFAFALERLYGRFAFPDPLIAVLTPFRRRVVSKHGKPDSPLGQVYRSLRQLRVRAAPHWGAERIQLAFLAILEDAEDREATWHDIEQEIGGQLDRMALPEGFERAEPFLLMGTADDLTARDLLDSQVLDFTYLCLL